MPQARTAPGRLSPEIQPDVVMMLCTAGHVDHGKTQLVQLLTGCRTDKLKEEQERGMTIDLGFAPCWIGGELCVGIVDVPGHERFVRNMVAGVSGIDMTILVIAADDGVMPQTVEHLEIMELLGVRRGVVALTKIDLVEPALRERRVEEIRGFLEGTFLAGAPICPVSSETFEGYPQFYDALVAAIRGVARRRRGGVFRMPIERVFTRPGFGAVLTGIPVAGSVAVGDALELVPGGQVGRARGVQCFLRTTREGGAGQCLALNVPELARAEPSRGQVLCRPGYLTAARQLYARVRAVPGLDPPLRNGEQVKLHAGTSETIGKIYLLESETPLGAGGSALASLVLEAPVAIAVHDAFLLRRPSPARAVAGGRVLAVLAEPWRAPRHEALSRLRATEAFFAGHDPDDADWDRLKVQHWLLREAPLGGAAEAIARATLLTPEAIPPILDGLAAEGWLLMLEGGHAIEAGGYRRCLAEAESRLRQAASGGQGALSLSNAALRQGLDWPAPVWARVTRDLEQAGLIRPQGAKLVLAQAAEQLSPDDRRLLERILKIYDETGFQSPRPDELPALLGSPPARVDRLLEHLLLEGQLVRLAKNVILGYTYLKQAQDRVVAIVEQRGTLDSADFKLEIRSTRKYALAILDWLDERKVTVRLGNDRKLAQNYRERLLR
jgi:selenocysteine-specific elongation factor